MDDRAILWILGLETLLAGGFYLLLPRITRRGLLFGVYVGEEAAAGERARRLTAAWTRAMAIVTLGSLVLGIGGAALLRRPILGVLSIVLLLVFSFGLYLWAYRAAKELAPAGPAPAAVALLDDDRPRSWLPHATLVLAVACGLLGLAYAAFSYPSLPARIPTHFRLSGAPDAWSTKSLGSVLLLPMIGLVQGFGLGLLCVLMTHAKRAVRLGDGGASLAAQHAFRRAVTLFLCGVTTIVSAMLLLITVFSIRTGLGLSAGMPWIVPALAGVLLVVTLVGALILALRYGQGGARLEGAAAGAPLTDGLADNRHWLLGMIYVNRHDPSILVERRFGLGYTINLGNWKAVAALAGFLLLTIGLSVLAAVASR